VTGDDYEAAWIFDLPDHLKRLPDAGDPLLDLGWIIGFEAFRPVLDIVVCWSQSEISHRLKQKRGTM